MLSSTGVLTSCKISNALDTGLDEACQDYDDFLIGVADDGASSCGEIKEEFSQDMVRPTSTAQCTAAACNYSNHLFDACITCP